MGSNIKNRKKKKDYLLITWIIKLYLKNYRKIKTWENRQQNLVWVWNRDRWSTNVKNKPKDFYFPQRI